MRTTRIALATAALLLLAAGDAGEFGYVVIDRAHVQAEPRYFSATVAEVTEGQKLEIHGADAGWAQVSWDGHSGWIPTSAIWDRERNRKWNKLLGLPDGERDTFAASKGFGEAVEAAYAEAHELDYAPVDAMVAAPSFPDPVAELRRFRRDGRLGEFAEGSNHEG